MSVIVATAIKDSRAYLSLLLVVAASVFAEPLITSPPPYSMRIVDGGTGEGVPRLRITTDNGIVCYTLLDGSVTWGESSLMGRAVRFEMQDDAHRFDSTGTTLHVTHGGHATVTVRRAAPDHMR
jgi:hypothetical protein